MDIRFDEKIVVVIGGSTGIGKASVEAFAKSGGKVIFTGIEKPEDINAEKFGAVEYCRLDVVDEGAVEAFAEHIDKRYGGADVLFNNAGILIPHPLHECTSEEWDKTMDVNVKGVFLCSKYIIPQMMRKGKGVIINTSSMSGLFADTGFCSYNASKGAVANLTRNMAVDYAQYGIRVNAVNPGNIKTPMYNAFAEGVGGVDVLDYGTADVYPLGRVGMPEDIAACVIFLASDQAAFVTGHNMLIDGGLTAHSGAQHNWERVKRDMAFLDKGGKVGSVI